MNQSRINRVIENMAQCGLTQLLVTNTPSVYYLTGHHIAPGERMLALYLNASGDIRLYANRLFALSDETLPITEFSDTDDCIDILAGGVKPGKLGIDNFWPSHFTIRLMEKRRDITPMVGSAPVENARMIKDAEEIAFSELGCESVKRFTIEDLPLTVALDCHGGNIFTEGKAQYRTV